MLRRWLSGRCLGLAALAIALSACQSPSYLGNENSPYYPVPAGSRLALERELIIPPEQLAVYIQNGRVLPNVEVQHLYPFCKFELERLANQARRTAPDEIVVVRTVQEISQGAVALAGPLLLARNSLHRLLIDSDGGPSGPSIQSFSTRMDLRSQKQPDIFRLTCAQWGYPGVDRHVTIGEIRRTLAGVFTLRLPHE